MNAPHQAVPLLPNEQDELRAQAQDSAVMIGQECFALAEEIATICDRYPGQWRPDDWAKINTLRASLRAALAIAESIKP